MAPRLDVAAYHAPVPGLAMLDRLVATARDLGTPAELVRTGCARELPPVADVTFYRVVQEALSNVRDHAPGAATRITVDHRPAETVLTVVNDAVARRPATTAARRGFGLAGMQERAELIGAAFDAGSTASGGWQVSLALHTGQWPHEKIDFTGKRVGVIGTGASAVQLVPLVARQASVLTVFQRTANYVVPARNGAVPQEVREARKRDYAGLRERIQNTLSGFDINPQPKMALELTDEEVRQTLKDRWEEGGFGFWFGTYRDIFVVDESNARVREFLHDRIRETVRDPETAELLVPKGYPFGVKRPPLDSGYYETFNLSHVRLVDVRSNPVARITPDGLRLSDGTEYELDVIIFATGFDAMTGPLNRIDIRGRGGHLLREKWSAGPRTYLGLMSSGYPNLFFITGPQSPSVLSNVPVSIEQHVDFVGRIIADLRERGAVTIEPTLEAEDAWVRHNQETAAATLFPRADSWYTGANIPGKPRVFVPSLDFVGPYRHRCDEVAASGYQGFAVTVSHEETAT